MTGAISYAARATDERVTCLRIFADANGETHMQGIDIALQPRKLFKNNPPLHLTDTPTASDVPTGAMYVAPLWCSNYLTQHPSPLGSAPQSKDRRFQVC
jgi:hypothetical protein